MYIYLKWTGWMHARFINLRTTKHHITGFPQIVDKLYSIANHRKKPSHPKVINLSTWWVISQIYTPISIISKLIVLWCPAGTCTCTNAQGAVLRGVGGRLFWGEWGGGWFEGSGGGGCFEGSGGGGCFEGSGGEAALRGVGGRLLWGEWGVGGMCCFAGT